MCIQNCCVLFGGSKQVLFGIWGQILCGVFRWLFCVSCCFEADMQNNFVLPGGNVQIILWQPLKKTRNSFGAPVGSGLKRPKVCYGLLSPSPEIARSIAIPPPQMRRAVMKLDLGDVPWGSTLVWHGTLARICSMVSGGGRVVMFSILYGGVMFSIIHSGVMYVLPSSPEGVMFSNLCSPNQVMGVVSLHCFLFRVFRWLFCLVLRLITELFCIFRWQCTDFDLCFQVAVLRWLCQIFFGGGSWGGCFALLEVDVHSCFLLLFSGSNIGIWGGRSVLFWHCFLVVV